MASASMSDNGPVKRSAYLCRALRPRAPAVRRRRCLRSSPSTPQRSNRAATSSRLGDFHSLRSARVSLAAEDQPSPLGASATDSPLSALSRFSAADSRRRRTRRERHAVGRPDLPVRPAPTGTQVRLFLRGASLRLLGGARPPEALPPRQRHLAACPE